MGIALIWGVSGVLMSWLEWREACLFMPGLAWLWWVERRETRREIANRFADALDPPMPYAAGAGSVAARIWSQMLLDEINKQPSVLRRLSLSLNHIDQAMTSAKSEGMHMTQGIER